MFVEVVLDEWSEDPVNLVTVQNGEEGIYVVRHVLEARGSRETMQEMTIELSISPEERTLRRMRAAFNNSEAIRLVIAEHDEELALMLGMVE
jgi:hypothetical protein